MYEHSSHDAKVAADYILVRPRDRYLIVASVRKSAGPVSRRDDFAPPSVTAHGRFC
jgi:hypothetical protein